MSEQAQRLLEPSRPVDPRTRTEGPAGSESRRHWGPTTSLVLLASIIVSFLASSSAPTPLYAIYQQRWGFSPITTTVVFGVYALAVLVALLVFGRISDYVGRRPVLLAALVAQAAVMVIFAVAPDVTVLFIARILQGLVTGAATGAIGAGMLDIDRSRGAFANAAVPGIGTGTGALVSGLLVQFLPAPTELVYGVLAAVFLLQAVAVGRLADTVSPKPGVWGSLRPEVSLPPAVRGPFLTAAPILFAVWSLAGFYASLGPAVVLSLTGSRSEVLGALSLVVLAGTAAASVMTLHRLGTRAVMAVGVGATVVGVAFTLVAMDLGSTWGFFVGSAIAGAGFGSGFQGGIRLVTPLAEPHQRAGVLSVLYVVSYLGMGLPAVVAGYLVVHDGGLLVTEREYGIAVIVLALLASRGLLRTRRQVSEQSA